MRECWDLPAREVGFLAEPPAEGQERAPSAADLNLLADPHSFCFEGTGEDAERDEASAERPENVIPFRRRTAAASCRTEESRR